MPQPKEYRHIRAWGRMMGSFEYYIRNQQNEASDDNAPLDAVYKKGDGWHVYSDVTNAATREAMDHYLSRMRNFDRKE